MRIRAALLVVQGHCSLMISGFSGSGPGSGTFSGPGSGPGSGSVSGSGSAMGCRDAPWLSKVRYDPDASDSTCGEDEVGYKGGKTLAKGGFFGESPIVRVELAYNDFLETELDDLVQFATDGSEELLLVSSGAANLGSMFVGAVPYPQAQAASAVLLAYAAAAEKYAQNTRTDEIREFIEKYKGKQAWDHFKTCPLWSHHFVLVETEDGSWYSVEKFCDYIDLRHAKKKSVLLDNQLGRCPGNGTLARKQPRVASSGAVTSGVTMKELSQKIVEQIKPDSRYSLLFDNCQHFARTLRDYLLGRGEL